MPKRQAGRRARGRSRNRGRRGGSDGEVSVILMLDQGTEVEVKLPGRFKVSPQIAGAIKAVRGVVDVQTSVGRAANWLLVLRLRPGACIHFATCILCIAK